MEVTASEAIAVAYGPSGRETIRLPLSLFAARPRLGSRVALALEPSPAAETARLESPGATSALDAAYEALDVLLVQRHSQGPDPELEQRIDAAWAHLDALQDAACAEVRRQIDASFDVPLPELERLLVEVRAQLAEDDE